MNKRAWGISAVLAIVCANTGCLSCCHENYGKVWKSGPECDLPTPCRNQVYVYMIHGLTPPTGCGLGKLRGQLSECGYANVGSGELVSTLSIALEIKKIAKCEPEAKFVLIGYDYGGAAANLLARELTAKAIPVEAVVLLDPLGCGKPSGVRTLLITSGYATSSAVYSDRLIVPETNHYTLPSNPCTVAAITDLLRTVALHNYHPEADPITAWSYPHAPEMQPIPLARGGEWDILADQGAVPSPLGTRVESQQIGTPAPTAKSATPAVIRVSK